MLAGSRDRDRDRDRDDRRRQVAEVDPQSDYRERPKDFTFRDASPQEAYA
jgi:hypothetical protein